jgi:hypothetical protein
MYLDKDNMFDFINTEMILLQIYNNISFQFLIFHNFILNFSHILVHLTCWTSTHYTVKLGGSLNKFKQTKYMLINGVCRKFDHTTDRYLRQLLELWGQDE